MTAGTEQALPAGAAPLVDAGEAEWFLRQFHAENPRAGRLEPRLAEVRAAIAETGTYAHTDEELAFGARVAWRNSSRCIGRLYWRSLQVRDRRDVGSAAGVFDELVEHLRAATNGGRIRPTITVFAAQAPGRPGIRVWNEQLVRYAGYRRPDGRVVGDPRNVGFTEAMTRMGWRGPGSRFDVLPLAIQLPDRHPELFELAREEVLEVEIGHPVHDWFAELGLRWHAVPAISSMRLEIGARNLADVDRYDMLPVIARRLGLDTTSDRSLWKDRALVELNLAVLWSFDRAGVSMTDHHTESRRFLQHLDQEQRAGRSVPADWTWVVPPLSPATTPVFHRYYDEADLRPNFVYAAGPRLPACPAGH